MWFKKGNKTTNNGLQLVSLHIPKSGGTSFRSTLNDIYSSGLARLDIKEDGRVWLNEELYADTALPGNINVIHGHFTMKDLLSLYPQAQGTPVITWLRHPVDRVLSNYYYLKERLESLLEERKNNLNILSKMCRTLSEYIEDPVNQNRMTKFVDGIPIAEFYFVGFLDDEKADLQRLREKMDWPALKVYRHNRTQNKNQPDAHVRQQIENCNRDDILLYEAAKELKSKGRWNH